MMYLLLALVLIVSYFLWTVIHETSHVAVVKLFKEDAIIKIKPYPHFVDGKLKFGYSEWAYRGEFSDNERGWIYFAPRVPALIGIVITTVFLLISKPELGSYLSLALMGGSIIDTLVFTIGYNEDSDLQEVSRSWKINSYILRIVFWILIAIPIVSLLPFLI